MTSFATPPRDLASDVARAALVDAYAPGRFDGQRHLFALRVYFEDTDLSGVVYHANYLRYFERARSDMLRLAGIDQRAAAEAGDGAYAITQAELRFHAPARLDDTLTILSEVVGVTAATCRIAQSIWRDETRLVTVGVTAALVAPDGRPRRQPRAWVDLFRSLLASSEPLSPDR